MNTHSNEGRPISENTGYKCKWWTAYIEDLGECKCPLPNVVSGRVYHIHKNDCRACPCFASRWATPDYAAIQAVLTERFISEYQEDDSGRTLRQYDGNDLDALIAACKKKIVK